MHFIPHDKKLKEHKFTFSSFFQPFTNQKGKKERYINSFFSFDFFLFLKSVKRVVVVFLLFASCNLFGQKLARSNRKTELLEVVLF